MHTHSAPETFPWASESEGNASESTALFICSPRSFLESCTWPKPRYCPLLAEGAAGVGITISMTSVRNRKLPLSRTQTLPSAALRAGAPCAGTAELPCFCQVTTGGWREATAHPAHFPCFHLTESFPPQSGHSLAVLFALELQRKPILQKYCFAAAPLQCLLYSHWSPTQCWGCFCSLCRANSVPMYSILQ